METPELGDAAAVKANPDSPQLPLRRALLPRNVTLYMAVPRLADERCFVELDPAAVADVEAAPTVSHMDDHGRRVGPDAVPDIDAIVVGSVAVTEDGARVGKGEGYSDLEYAVLRELGAVDDATPVITTVHDAQVVEDAPVGAHDVPVDVVCTPTRTVRTGAGEKPSGVVWADVDEERLREVPVLASLRE